MICYIILCSFHSGAKQRRNKKGFAMSQVAERPRVSDRQIQFLEYLIWKSRDASEFAKKCLIYLVRQSERLSRQVRLILNRDVVMDVRHGFHDMSSSMLTTHINELLCLAGSDLWVDYGVTTLAFNPIGDVFVEFFPSLDEINAIVPDSPYKH